MTPTIPPELAARLAAADFTVGSDECGYGCLAGPLVVCAAIIPKVWPLVSEVKDSKAFTGTNAETRRQEAARKILPYLSYVLVSVPVEEIDAKGVYKCLLAAHSKAITDLLAKFPPSGKTVVIVDGTLQIPYQKEGETHMAVCLPKADSLVPAVSAASIVGKVARDAHMVKLSKTYADYGLERHKGYDTPEHRHALKELGFRDIHRKSFKTVRDLLKVEPAPEVWDLDMKED